MNETCSARPVGGFSVGPREEYRPGPEPFRRDAGRVTATVSTHKKDETTGVVVLNQTKTQAEIILDAVKTGHQSLNAIQRCTGLDRKRIRDIANKQVKAGKLLVQQQSITDEKIFALPDQKEEDVPEPSSQSQASAEVDHDLKAPESMVDSLGDVVETDDGSTPVPNTYVCPIFVTLSGGNEDRLLVGAIVRDSKGALHTQRMIPDSALRAIYGDKSRGMASHIDYVLKTLYHSLIGSPDQKLEQMPQVVNGLMPGKTRHIYASSVMDAFRICAIKNSSLENFEAMFVEPEMVDDDVFMFSENNDVGSTGTEKGIEMEGSETDLGYMHARLEHLYRTAQSSLGAFWESVVELRTMADDALQAKEKLLKVYEALGQAPVQMDRNGHGKGGHSDVQP